MSKFAVWYRPDAASPWVAAREGLVWAFGKATADRKAHEKRAAGFLVSVTAVCAELR